MPAAGQIIRLFVSSTFADFALERTILQRRVFPALRQECQAAGFRFQPIDLRWGITTSRDRTLRLWDMARGNEIMRWETNSQLFRCAFHPNGRQVMVDDELGDLHFLAPLGI